MYDACWFQAAGNSLEIPKLGNHACCYARSSETDADGGRECRCSVKAFLICESLEGGHATDLGFRV